MSHLRSRLDGGNLAGLVVHEWAERTGGAERVVQEMLTAFPDACLQVLWNDAPERFPQARETWLARTPLRRNKALALPFMLPTWRALAAKPEPDWILASSHLFAHHVTLKGKGQGVPKYSYVHTPARYIWEPQLDQRGNNALVRTTGWAFKRIDRKRAAESRELVANSEFTRARIQRVWERDARVIYPPVDVDRIRSEVDWRARLPAHEVAAFERLPADFLLGVSRFVPYKGLEHVIAAGEATDLPVVLAGSGPAREDLEARGALASVPVHVIYQPSDSLVYALYQAARALVFPAIEDFGIVPVEAIAAGTPVVARSVGGAAESVQTLKGGTLVDAFSPADWRSAVEGTSAVDSRAAQERSQQFSAARFRAEITALVDATAAVSGDS